MHFGWKQGRPCWVCEGHTKYIHLRGSPKRGRYIRFSNGLTFRNKLVLCDHGLHLVVRLVEKLLHLLLLLAIQLSMSEDASNAKVTKKQAEPFLDIINNFLKSCNSQLVFIFDPKQPSQKKIVKQGSMQLAEAVAAVKALGSVRHHMLRFRSHHLFMTQFIVLLQLFDQFNFASYDIDVFAQSASPSSELPKLILIDALNDMKILMDLLTRIVSSSTRINDTKLVHTIFTALHNLWVNLFSGSGVTAYLRIQIHALALSLL